MGTIKCGFWTSRFIVTPDEFANFADLVLAEGFAFQERDIKSQYEAFYKKRMDTKQYHKVIPGVHATIQKPDFNSSFHISTAQQWRFYYTDGTSALDSAFLQISSPKQYSVSCDDGVHFTYEDILEREPLAKSYFDAFTKPIKSITRPLYQFGKPMYSVRISEQAYIDLQESAFYKNMSGELPLAIRS